jgi:hypothetical protein
LDFPVVEAKRLAVFGFFALRSRDCDSEAFLLGEILSRNRLREVCRWRRQLVQNMRFIDRYLVARESSRRWMTIFPIPPVFNGALEAH